MLLVLISCFLLGAESVFIAETSALLEACVESCPFDPKINALEVGCKRGCQIGFAATRAGGEGTALCGKACEDAFPISPQQQATCTPACSRFSMGESTVFPALPESSNMLGSLPSIVQRLFDSMKSMMDNGPFGSGDMGHSDDGEDQHKPTVVTRIRLFIPLGESERNNDGPSELLPALSQPESMRQPMNDVHHRMHFMHASQTEQSDFGWKVSHVMRSIVADPLRLLLILTLITLLILFIVQVAVHVRRRRRHRVGGYQYTELPSYEEVASPDVVKVKEPDTGEPNLKA